MKEPDPVDCWSCPAHEAVLQFSEAAYPALARKVIFRLQRIEATGIFGDDRNHRTLWDEFCHDVQEGPHILFTAAMDTTVFPFLSDVADGVPKAQALLLSIGAYWDIGNFDDDEPTDPFPRTLRNDGPPQARSSTRG